ncbi:hypothetical protein [Polyangium sorediatum]|uniref:Uncharacterized protein n=1 Tax=Polyangium sorediatum TaxID=889274 RepID=A0ABT6NUM8_9BACT|nr:hypothetical protein [Polyangium sorediatum]MDI1432013.1 hypothetical protein [Polyangium sorediatum]
MMLAIDKLLLSDTNPDGSASPQAWRQYGMNLDGLFTTAESLNTCKPRPGGTAVDVLPDGDNGKDNAFGKNILPILMGYFGSMGEMTNAMITNGDMTLLFSLSGSGQGGPACAATGKLFLGADLGKPPLFDGSDIWPIDPSSLTNPADATSAACVFPETAVAENTVQAQPPSELQVVLSLDGARLVLPIRHARISMQLDAQGATAGQIGGLIPAAEFVDAFKKAAGSMDDAFCDPNSATAQSLFNMIRDASDILSDGTQDPKKQCDAISIGLGFTMKHANLGSVAPAAPPSESCVP